MNNILTRQTYTSNKMNKTSIVGTDIKSINFRIFDRWGNLMFESKDKKFKWDGTFNGKKCNSGIYAYAVELIYLNNKQETISGNITLIR